MQTQNNIKVLTLWQPWATLLAHGFKLIETRPAVTSHVGVYLIHAAQARNRIGREMAKQEPFKSALEAIGYQTYSGLPFGAIVGSYDHQRCTRIVDTHTEPDPFTDDPNGWMFPPLSPELDFGDYTPGRYAWQGTGHSYLDKPLPYKNGQGYYRKYTGPQHALLPMIRAKSWSYVNGVWQQQTHQSTKHE